MALVPLLATIVDSKSLYEDDTAFDTGLGSSYGGVYAIQQIRFKSISNCISISICDNIRFFIDSVNMAYFLGPLLGGEISQYIGFSWLMSMIGFANIFYGIYLMRTVMFVFQPEVCKSV